MLHLKVGCDSFRKECFMLTVARHFYATFTQYMPYFCKNKKHKFGWCGQLPCCQTVFAFWKTNMLFVKSVFNFFIIILRQNLFTAKLKIPNSSRRSWNNPFFLKSRKLRIKRNKMQNDKLLLLFNVNYLQ